jgi:hypothetical protein
MIRFDGSDQWEKLERDDRFIGKIKWYMQPIIFGGDPNAGSNMTWVDLPNHQKLVRWWNDKYRELSGEKEP